MLLTLERRPPRYVDDGKLIALCARSRAVTKETRRIAEKERQSTNWGGTINDAAPADTKIQVVVTPETVQNLHTCLALRGTYHSTQKPRTTLFYLQAGTLHIVYELNTRTVTRRFKTLCTTLLLFQRTI